MKFQYFNGGLGNQLFQYIFYRYYQLHAKIGDSSRIDEIWLDDMKFFKVHEHNGYELERVFGVKPNLVSNYFEPDVWQYMVDIAKNGGGDLCQQMKDMGSDITMLAETSNYSFDGKVYSVTANDYHPQIVTLQGNIYYFGYWINKNWWLKVRDVLMKELVFAAPTDSVNQGYLDTIQKENCVSVHIRRGDFVTFDWGLPTEFYHQAMECISKDMPDATYLVFSDDIPWCKDNYRALGLDIAKDKIIFVTGNESDRSYNDMNLMSQCQGMIIANSAFSYFAALYNNHPGKMIVNPLQGFRDV